MAPKDDVEKLIKECNHPDTFKEWMKRQFQEGELEDICKHGVDGGFSGLIYYGEVCKLYDEYEKEIWTLAADMADEMGHKSVAEFVGTFNRADMASDPDQFKNLLVWFAAEEYARELTDE